MKHLALQAQIEWKYFKDPTSGYWIAVCEPLQQTVSGETWVELNECIAQTLDLLFRELLEKGELDQFLCAHGWKMGREETEEADGVRFDVPWRLLERQGAYDQEGVLCK
jgi:predicted RNase H-like HicB family nuclease